MILRNQIRSKDKQNRREVNQPITQTGNAPSTGRKKMDLTSDIVMEPDSKVICDCKDVALEELTSDTRGAGNYSTGIAGDTSSISCPQELETIPDTVKPNRIHKPRSKPIRKPVVSESMEINNNSSHDTILATQAQTDLIPKISKSKGKPRGSKSKIGTKSKEVLAGSPMIETGAESSHSRLEMTPISATEKLKTSSTCESENPIQEKIVQSESKEMNIDPGCNVNIVSTGQLQTDSISQISELQVEPKRKLRGRPRIKQLQVILKHDPRIEIKNNSKIDLKCKHETSVEEKLTQLELIEMNNNPESKSEDITSADSLEIDSTPKTSEQRVEYVSKLRGRASKKVRKSKCMSETAVTIPSECWPEVESISEKAKPRRKRVRKSGNTRQKKTPVKSEPANTPHHESHEPDEGVPSLTQTGTDPILNISAMDSTLVNVSEDRGRLARILIEEEPLNVSMNSGFESNDTSLATQVHSDPTSDKIKPKPKRIRKPRAGRTTNQKKSMNQVEINAGSETNQTFLMTKIQTDSIPVTITPKRKRVRKPKSEKPIAMIKSDESQAARYLPNENKDPSSEHLNQKLEINTTDNSEKIFSEVEPRTKSSILKSTRTNDDKIYRAKVVLWDIAYGEDPTYIRKRKEIPEENNESLKCLTVRNVADSSPNRNMDQLKPHDIITASVKLVKKNDKPIVNVSSIGVPGIKHSTPERQRSQKTETVSTDVRVTVKNCWSEICASKLTLRDPGTNSSGASETDVLSSLGKDLGSSIKNEFISPLTKLTQQNSDFGKILLESMSSLDGQSSISPMPNEIMGLETPLDLSMRDSGKSMSSETNFSAPDKNSVEETCRGIDKHQSRFGSPNFNVTDLSTSLPEIDNGAIITTFVNDNQSQGIDICGTSRLPELNYGSGSSTFYAGSSGIEKLSSKSAVSIKVSLPAEYYYETKSTTSTKSKTVTERKVSTPQKSLARTASNNTNRRASKNIKCSTSEQKSSSIKLKIAESDKLSDKNINQCAESTTRSITNVCRLDNTDFTCVEKTIGKCDPAIINVDIDPETTVLEVLKTPLISDIRSLPRIINDEIFPKGTLLLSLLNSTATKMDTGRFWKNLNEVEETQKIRPLTVDKEDAYTSIVNASQSQETIDCSNQAYTSADMENIDIERETVDDLCHSENPNNINFENNSPEEMQTNKIVEQHFDPIPLWKICPELAEYFRHDDIVNNNNNDNGMTNFDNFDHIKTNRIDNSVYTLPTEMEIGRNEENNADPPPHDVIHIPECANDIPDALGTALAVDIDNNQMEVESSESIVANDDQLHPRERTVLANLTLENLRNFDKISNNNGANRLWRDYLSHENISESSNVKPLPDATIESSCGVTESILESLKEFSQAKLKKRKRKWMENEKDTSTEPVIEEKKVKLNRNRWNNESQDVESTANSSRIKTAKSNNSNNSVILSLARSPLTPIKNISEKFNTREGRIRYESNVSAETIENNSIKHDCKPKELEQKIVDCIDINENQKIKVSEILKCEFGNESLSQEIGTLCNTSPKSSKNNGSNNRVDRNGNLTQIKSTPTSEKSESISKLNKSTDSKKSDKQSQEKKNSEPQQSKLKNIEEPEDEYDDDYISLFAESIFTNFDQTTNITEYISISPLYDRPEKSEEKFQEMADVGAYFDRNIQECNEAYESCAQEGVNMINPIRNENFNASTPRAPDENLNHHYSSQPMQRFERDPYPLATLPQKSNLSNLKNLKDRLGAKPKTLFSPAYVESFFSRQCYMKLRRGLCMRESCRYHHQLTPALQDIGRADPNLFFGVIDHAISRNYNYFIEHIYWKALTTLEYRNIMKLFMKLLSNDLMTDEHIKRTVNTVRKIGISLKEFLSEIARSINVNENTIGECILGVVGRMIESGAYWDTCRDLLIRIRPSILSINAVISECIQIKDKSHIEDVYVNYIRRLTTEQAMSLNISLRKQFDLLLVKYNLIHELKHQSVQQTFENLNHTDHKTVINVIKDSENNYKTRGDIPTILSPDDKAHHIFDNASQLSPESSQNNEFSSQEQASGRRSATLKNQDTRINTATTNHSFSQRRRSSAAEDSPLVKRDSLDLNIDKTSESAASSSSHYKLYPIDDLPPPRSAFRDRHWKLHLALYNFKEALNHNEYQYALKILNRYSDMEQTHLTSSYYKMLRQNVMGSAHHVKNLIKLSVWMGVNKYVNETLFNLGTYCMIELCNSNAWVLAYSLYKSLKNSDTSMENTAAFALISAEICIANRHPLKAFTILKQRNMLCTSRSKWNVTSEPNDKPVRVTIINLLLDVLCQDYPDRAYYIFTFLLKDQNRIYHPVDLTTHVDELVTGILARNYDDLITDLGKMIIEHKFMLNKSIFQSLVVNIFGYDIALCRKLYRYGTWIGVYPIMKLTLPLHILIKTNWTKEEMYLVVIGFLEKLSMEIGPAVDRIGPNQFTIYLVFELMPFKQQLPKNNNAPISNTDELKMSKELMKTVLREKFNPPLRTIIAERERFMKLQSQSVVNYLKGMITARRVT